MFGRRFRTALAAFLGAALVMTVVQSVPASADTTLSTPLQVNFQTATSTTPAGYTADTGLAYDATRGFGWVTQSSGAALDLSANTRQRNVNSNPLLDTFIQMQNTASSGSTTAGAWKAAVPNGTYTVTVAVGDPSYYDSTHTIRVEGTTLISNFKPTASNPNSTATASVNVTDGFLNVDAIGGTNTKLDYITATPAGTTTTPTVSSVTPADGATNVAANTAVSVALSDGVDATTANSSSIQVVDPGNNQVVGQYTVNTSSVSFQPTGALANNTKYTVKVTGALHASDGTAYAPSTTTFTTIAAVTPSAAGVHVNFGAATTAAISGYNLDYGQAYDASRGYGWVLASDASTPLNLVGNGRERNVVADKRLDTFMMPQTKPGSGITTPGSWKAPIANGTYNVTVGVGDPSYTDSVDVVNVEGVNVVNFTPSTATPQSTVTKTVSVTDGVLNVDETGGTNTKIDYIDAIPQTTTPEPVPPTVNVTVGGTTDTNGAYVTSANVSIASAATNGTITGVTYILDSASAVAYTAPFNVTNVGAHTVTATATDSNGLSTSSTKTFSVVAPNTGGTAGSTTAHYEFGIQTTTPVSGYTLDYGAAYNGTYGWENASTGAPLSYIGNGRDRGVNSNKLLDRFMMPQLANSTSGNHTYGKWEAVVGNGSYDVTIGIGDPSYTDSVNVWTIEGTRLASFTPSVATPQTVQKTTVTVADGKITVDPSAGTNGKIDYIDIVPAGTVTPPPGDTTPPTVSAVVNGTTNSTGAYLDTATVAVSANDNVGVASIKYTLDSGAVTTYSQPVQVNSTGAHVFVATATDAAGNTASITKNFTITASSGTGTKPTSLTVTAPADNLGLGSRVVFSTVYNQSRTGQNITLGNKGAGTLNVTGLTVTAPFQLCTGQATSFNIVNGATATVCVQYRPSVSAATNGTQVDQGTLIVKTNDATVPNYVVTLGGVDAENYESYHEPDLQQMFDALGFTDNVVITNKPQGNSISSTSSAIGDEVLAPYFKKLDTSKSVQLIPLAHYSGKSSSDSNSFGWYNYGSSTQNLLYCFPGGADGTNNGYGQNQLLLPTIKKCSGTTGTTAFNPAGSFGIVDPYPGYTTWSDDAKNGGGWHNMRAYPAKDANGNVIAGQYLIGDDIGSPANNSAKNWDYQDFAYLLVNATPDTTKTQPAGGLQNKTVSSFGSAGGLLGTGFTSYQGNRSDTSKINVTGGQLKVTTSGLDSNTSHVMPCRSLLTRATSSRSKVDWWVRRLDRQRFGTTGHLLGS